MTRCKNGSRKNKSGICVEYSKKKRESTSSTSRKRKGKEIGVVYDSWNSDVEQDFAAMLKDMREGKMKKMEGYKQAPPLDCKSCLQRLSSTELQQEIDSRKKQEGVVNVLIPRKKNVPKGGSGVWLAVGNKDHKAAFEYFVQNSKFKIMSKGSFGITLLARLNDDSIVSPYRHMDMSMFDQSVRSIIIKVCMIDANTKAQFNCLEPVSRNDFIDEVNIQTDVFLKTMNYLNPICPAIVYADITTDVSLVKKVLTQYRSSCLQDIIDNKNNQRIHEIGIIAMEMAENYDTVYQTIRDASSSNNSTPSSNASSNANASSLNPTPSVPDIMQMEVQYALIRLLHETGYTHGDHHMGNIMTKHIGNYRYTTLLIDYGLSFKLSEKQKKPFDEWYANGDFYHFIMGLCDIYRKDKIDLRSYDVYTDICNIKEDMATYNQKMKQFIDEKEQLQEKQVQTFNANNKQLSLPLSNAAKNKVFYGLLNMDSPSQNIEITDEMFAKSGGVSIIRSLFIKAMNMIVLETPYWSQSYADMVRSAYYFVYLSSLFSDKFYAAICGIYFGKGFNKDFSAKDWGDLYKIMLKSTSDSEAKAFAKETMSKIQKYKYLSNVRLVTVLDYISSNNINKQNIEAILLDPKTYTEPKEHAKIIENTLGQPNNNNTPPVQYAFPFPEENMSFYIPDKFKGPNFTQYRNPSTTDDTPESTPNSRPVMNAGRRNRKTRKSRK